MIHRVATFAPRLARGRMSAIVHVTYWFHDGDYTYPSRFTSLIKETCCVKIGTEGIRVLFPPLPPIPVQSRKTGSTHDADWVAIIIVLTATTRRWQAGGGTTGIGILPSDTKRRVLARPLAPADGDCRALIVLHRQRQRIGGWQRAQGGRS